jgi:hypothetical protein
MVGVDAGGVFGVAAGMSRRRGVSIPQILKRLGEGIYGTFAFISVVFPRYYPRREYSGET